MITELVDWLQTLAPEFLFLLALPLAIGALGLAAEALRREARPGRTVPERPSSGPAASDPLHFPR